MFSGSNRHSDQNPLSPMLKDPKQNLQLTQSHNKPSSAFPSKRSSHGTASQARSNRSVRSNA